MSTDLIGLKDVNVIEVFQAGNVDDILERIRKEATSFIPNVETNKGRNDIASIAHKVAKSKTYLDSLGKDLVSGWKQKAKVVDVERKKMRDYLDNLKEEVRQPLTDWEDAEKERIEKHEWNLQEIIGGGSYSLEKWMELSLEAMKDRLKEIEAEKIDDSWEEYANDAAKAKDGAIAQIKEAIEKREKYDAEQAELAQLRAKAEKARSEKAEKDAIEAKERAEREAKEAKENAARKAEEAAQAERDRIEQERIAEEAAAKKREADKKHRAKINNAAVDAFVAAGLSQEKAKDAVTAIAKGQIPYVRISY